MIYENKINFNKFLAFLLYIIFYHILLISAFIFHFFFVYLYPASLFTTLPTNKSDHFLNKIQFLLPYPNKLNTCFVSKKH